MFVSKRYISSILLSVLCSFFSNGTAAITNASLKLHLASFHKDREAIERTISQYNKNSAGFYATSGEVLGGLNVIHATQLIKRRLFQDINMLKRDNVLLIFDLDSQKITDVRF